MLHLPKIFAIPSSIDYKDEILVSKSCFDMVDLAPLEFHFIPITVFKMQKSNLRCLAPNKIRKNSALYNLISLN